MSTVAIDWGDGSAVEQVTVSGDVSSWTFSGKAHTYAAPGQHQVKLTGLAQGQDIEQVTTPDAPQFAGTATTGTTGGTAGTTVTVPKPSGLVVGDTLVACLRGQVASAIEFSCPGWRRLTPDYDGTNTSGPRVTVIMVKPIVDLAAEPASYVFTRSTSERKNGIIFRVTGAGAAQPSGRDGTVGGSGTQAIGATRHTGPYAVATAPVLRVFAGGGEHTSGNSENPTVTPSGLTQRGFVTTDTVQTTSRTSLWAGTAQQNASPVPQEDFATASTSSGLAAVALRPAVPYLFSSVSAMLAKPGFTWAHRGNSNVYAEMSRNAYDNAVARGYAVLEYSLARTSDGVWFGLHDEDINRTSGLAAGTQPAASTMTWAQIQAFNNVLAVDGVARPYLRWEDFLAAYPNHIIGLDPKYTWSQGAGVRTEFWNICAQVGAGRLICKGYINNASLRDGAATRGYQSWGYGYQADVDGGLFATFQAGWTILGLEIGATQAAWNTVKGYGQKVVGHIAMNVADYNAALAKGADGVQVGGSAVVPAVNGAV